MNVTDSPELFFVTGAPRSGTTFIGDWVSEDPQTYCVHEVWNGDELLSSEDFRAHLLHCAAVGSDRLGKPLQREFVRWDAHRPRTPLRRLGLKEPLTWRVEPPALPPPLDELFARTRHVVVVRHPYDVIASGRLRARTTRNWPGFDLEEHCDLWTRSVRLPEAAADERETLRLVWEDLMADPETARRQLEDFLGLDLPRFDGNELSAERLHELRTQVNRAAGLPGSKARALLSASDYARIRPLVGDGCERLGYAL